jgi:hypothetical protein
MIQFNPDGSIKLPGEFARKKEQDALQMKTQRCIKVTRSLESNYPPKRCRLRITLSDAFTDDRFIHTIYGYFQNRSSVPSKLTKLSEKEFEVEIGSDFKRCTDCNSLVNELREFLDGKLVEEKGTCSFNNQRNYF